jgi:hypothetical protein
LADIDFIYTERNLELTRYIPVINRTTHSINPYASDKTYSVINSDFPYSLILLHDKKKKTIYQHQNKTTLLVALNTFNCVVTATGNKIKTKSYSDDGTMQLIE